MLSSTDSPSTVEGLISRSLQEATPYWGKWPDLHAPARVIGASQFLAGISLWRPPPFSPGDTREYLLANIHSQELDPHYADGPFLRICRVFFGACPSYLAAIVDPSALRRHFRSQIGHLPVFSYSLILINGAQCGALGCRTSCVILPIAAPSIFAKLSA